MASYLYNNFRITPDKTGVFEYAKVSYPVRYGKISEIRTDDHIFQFNLNGELKFVRSLAENWPHPGEWLKRTMANDWIYYASDNYSKSYDLIGEYYLPCFSYSDNPFTHRRPFMQMAVCDAVRSLNCLIEKLKSVEVSSFPQNIRVFIDSIIRNDEQVLSDKANRFHEILGGWTSVLPPDVRHVDYEVIPINIADGCLYKCGFCSVKNNHDFTVRSQRNIKHQILALKSFYGIDRVNYCSIFLGQHDGLHAGIDLIEFSALTAWECFDFKNSLMKTPRLFLFGSVDALLGADEKMFNRIDRLPYRTIINLGLESFDQETLDFLQKPTPASSVKKAFHRMVDINNCYENIDLTANFIISKDLPPAHIDSIIENCSYFSPGNCTKGSLYLSLLGNSLDTHDIMKVLVKIKKGQSFPAFLYLIQRL
jgi:hypothetical protein